MQDRRVFTSYEENKDVTTMEVGDYYYEDRTVSPDIIPGKTILGVCVIPASHTDNGYPRIVGLHNLDSGGIEGNGRFNYIGTKDWIIAGGFDGYTQFPNTSDGLDCVGFGQNSVASFGSNSSHSNANYQLGDYWYHNTNAAVPYPYLTDGSVNQNYRYQSTSATYNINGRSVYNNCIRQYGTYTHAPFIPLVYKLDTISGGFWYLPTVGELGYICANRDLIYNKISAAGGTSIENTYWTANIISSTRSGANYNTQAFVFSTGIGTVSQQNGNYYSTTWPIRPFLAVWLIQDYEEIDLGLPSGALWSNKNIGAITEEESGEYYNRNDGDCPYIAKTSRPSQYDCAAIKIGSDWRTSTYADVEELISNTDYSWTTINGVPGGKFTSRTDSTKYIFIPACGKYYMDTFIENGTAGYIWCKDGSVNNKAAGLKVTAEGCSIAQCDGSWDGIAIRGVKQ